MFFFKSKPNASQPNAARPIAHNESPADHEALQGDVAVIEALRQLREMQESCPVLPA